MGTLRSLPPCRRSHRQANERSPRSTLTVRRSERFDTARRDARGSSEAGVSHARRLRPLAPAKRQQGWYPPGLSQVYDACVKRINCVCGYVIEAEDEDELAAKVREHLRVDHPELVGKVSRDDILAQAEET
jgi:predicted small metal-binding protein